MRRENLDTLVNELHANHAMDDDFPVMDGMSAKVDVLLVTGETNDENLDAHTVVQH